MNRTKQLSITIALIAAIIIMANLLSTQLHLRLDLTQGSQYTLSHATRDILHDLHDPVTIKAYFSKNLPPNIAQARRDFRDLLIEYANKAPGMIQYSFVDPNASEDNEQEAQSNGIRPVLIDVRECLRASLHHDNHGMNDAEDFLIRIVSNRCRLQRSACCDR